MAAAAAAREHRPVRRVPWSFWKQRQDQCRNRTPLCELEKECWENREKAGRRKGWRIWEEKENERTKRGKQKKEKQKLAGLADARRWDALAYLPHLPLPSSSLHKRNPDAAKETRICTPTSKQAPNSWNFNLLLAWMINGSLFFLSSPEQNFRAQQENSPATRSCCNNHPKAWNNPNNNNNINNTQLETLKARCGTNWPNSWFVHTKLIRRMVKPAEFQTKAKVCHSAAQRLSIYLLIHCVNSA